MPNRKEKYSDMERFSKTRNAQRKRYYAKTSYKYPKREWTIEEDKLVLAHIMTDMELSRLIERSVIAIQKRRCILKKRK